MGLLKFFKNGVDKKNVSINLIGERMDRLTNEGKLPYGWHYANRDFTEKIQSEYSYFFNNWIDSRMKSPKEQYAALKSFVIYMNDAKRLCQSKGECFSEWFKVCADDNYIRSMENELNELETNFDTIQKEYERKQIENKQKEKLLKTLETDIIEKLKQNKGITQSEFVKMFDNVIQNEVRTSLYYMDKNKTIHREKSGRSYILTISKKE